MTVDKMLISHVRLMNYIIGGGGFAATQTYVDQDMSRDTIGFPWSRSVTP